MNTEIQTHLTRNLILFKKYILFEIKFYFKKFMLIKNADFDYLFY